MYLCADIYIYTLLHTAALTFRPLFNINAYITTVGTA